MKQDEIERYLSGEMDPEEKSRVEDHLGNCSTCSIKASGLGDHNQATQTLTHTFDPAETLLAREPAGVRPMESPAVIIEGYTIIREIARGGMGVVYEAVQTKLNRRVALKILPALGGDANSDAVVRFRREATAAAKLHHTNIVPIYDFGLSRHTHYYAMELIEGQPLNEMIRHFASADAQAASHFSLADLMGRIISDTPEPPSVTKSMGISGVSKVSHRRTESSHQGRLYYRRVAQWMADAADALAYAHDNGIIHRDIKPGNLILSTDGRIMIVDFGLAKSQEDVSVTLSGSLVGTLRYMSPEQASGKKEAVGNRSDIYSLCATIYELLTFQPAFRGRDEKETIGMILTRDPLPPRKIIPAVPREMETICLKGLEKDPKDRYQSATDLADDLRRFTQDLPIVARSPGVIGRIVKFVKRRKALSAAIAAMVLLAASITIGISLANTARDERLRNEVERRKTRDATVNALNQKGVREWGVLKDWDAAQATFTEALREDPENFRTLYNLASMKKDQYFAQHDNMLLDQANVYLDQALALKLEPQFYVHMWNLKGSILRIGGRYSEAIEAHMKAVAADENNYANWVSMAFTYAMMEDAEEAERCLLRSIELPDGSQAVMAVRNLLSVQLLLRKVAAAKTLEKLPEKANSDTGSILLKAKFYLEMPGHEDLGKSLNFAIGANIQIGDQHPDARAKRVLALAELRNGHWQKAIDTAGEALKLNSEIAYAHLIIAAALANSGQTSDAQQHLQAAEAAWPKALKTRHFIASADKGVLWFDTAEELTQLRDEGEKLISVNSDN